MHAGSGCWWHSMCSEKICPGRGGALLVLIVGGNQCAVEN